VMLAAALRHKDTEEGIACVGTALESRTLKVDGRAFLFLNPKKAYFKLGPSLDEAKRLAASGAVKPGGAGWTSLMWDQPCPVSDATLRRWVDESRALVRGAAKPAATVDLLSMKRKGTAGRPKGKG
jgi:hypothetical protein